MECVTSKKKKKASSFPFIAPLMSVGSRGPSQVGNTRSQEGSEAGHFLVHSGEAKDNPQED